MKISRTPVLNTEAQLADLLKLLTSASEVAFDTETNSLSHDRFMVGFSLSFWAEMRGDVAWYVPVAHEAGDDLFAVAPENAPSASVRAVLEALFISDKTVWIHNAKFDLGVLRNYGLSPSRITARVYDTRAVSWLLEPEREGGHGLKALVKRQLGYEMGEYSQFASYSNQAAIPIGMIAKYASDDALYLLKLARHLSPLLSTDDLKVLTDLESPFTFIVEEMEHYGMKVDTAALKRAGTIMGAEIQQIEQEFRAQFGDTSNISSPQWLADNLCGKIWGTIGLEKKGARYSTDSEHLKAWAEGEVEGTTDTGRAVASAVLRHRELSKLVNTYTSTLLSAADERGRVHASFNQFGTATGRLSCSEPNLQNIPSSRSEWGAAIRKAFIAEDGYKIINADYSQVELRVTAHFSSDPVMSQVYQENGDIHQMTADACGCSRFAAKAVNFGLIYKMGPRTLANKINTSEVEAKAYITRYFERYSGVATWQNLTVSRARANGYTQTITGRKRQLPNINSVDRFLRTEAERIAINTRIQGSAADIIKIAMRNFIRERTARGYTSEDMRFIGQVHDEVLLEVKDHLVDEARELLKSTMERSVLLAVPLIAEPVIVSSWGDAK